MLVTACSKEEEENSENSGFQGRHIKKVAEVYYMYEGEIVRVDTVVSNYVWDGNQLSHINHSGTIYERYNLSFTKTSLNFKTQYYYRDNKVAAIFYRRIGSTMTTTYDEFSWQGDKIRMRNNYQFEYKDGKLHSQFDDYDTLSYVWEGDDIAVLDHSFLLGIITEYRCSYDNNTNPFYGLMNPAFHENSEVTPDLYFLSWNKNNVTRIEIDFVNTGYDPTIIEVDYQYDASGYPVKAVYTNKSNNRVLFERSIEYADQHKAQY